MKVLAEETKALANEHLAHLVEVRPAMELQVARELLEAVGILAFMGLAHDWVEGLSVWLRKILEKAAACAPIYIDWGRIPNSAIDIVNELKKLDLTDLSENADLEERLVELFEVRTNVEFVLEGARAITGKPPTLNAQQIAFLADFERIVGPQLWRSLPLGTRRAAHVAWALPEKRHQLWWWFRGCDLPHTALDSLATTAEMIVTFPETWEELERLIAAQKLLHTISSQPVK